MLHWGPGPHRLGCVYHQQGVCRFGDDAVIADVFVMPKIIKVRPIAITIGRYRKSKAIAKQKWHLRDPKALAGVGAKAAEMFEAIGVREDLAADLGHNVEELLARESESLVRILASHS